MKSGFTLVELVIAIGILAILFSVGVPLTYDFYRGQIINTERDNLVMILQRARSEALANINESSHGAYLGNSANYIIFQGTAYASRNAAYDETFPRTGGLAINGPTEIDFQSPDAYVSSPGTITISNQNETFSISVNSEGGIDW